MNWYYVDAGAQAGPVDEAQLQQLVLLGKIQPNTLVWHEKLAAWTPYSQVVPAAPVAPDPNLPPVVGGLPPDCLWRGRLRRVRPGLCAHRGHSAG